MDEFNLSSEATSETDDRREIINKSSANTMMVVLSVRI